MTYGGEKIVNCQIKITIIHLYYLTKTVHLLDYQQLADLIPICSTVESSSHDRHTMKKISSCVRSQQQKNLPVIIDGVHTLQV